MVLQTLGRAVMPIPDCVVRLPHAHRGLRERGHSKQKKFFYVPVGIHMELRLNESWWTDTRTGTLEISEIFF